MSCLQAQGRANFLRGKRRMNFLRNDACDLKMM
jgi:hypothetical protein